MTLTTEPQEGGRIVTDSDTTGLTILFGSQTGNAEYLAHQIFGKAQKAGHDVAVASLEEWLQEGPPRVQRLLVVTSTHDNGHMPDNAAEFWDWLQGLDESALAGLPYAVLSIGDSMYDDFCKAGHDIDSRLDQLGALRLVEGIDCDIDFEFTAGKWAGPAVEALLAANAWDGATAAAAEPAAEPQAPGGDRTMTARIVESRRLSRAGSEKDVVHYALAFDGAFDYEPGDSLAVFPTNSDSLVNEWLAVYGDVVEPTEDGRPLRDILRHDVELRLPHPGLVVGLASLKPDSAPIERILGLIRTGDREKLDAWLWGRDVLDVLTDLGCLHLPIESVLAQMRPLQHRDYSISSSPALDDGHVHITVNGVEYGGARGAYRGVATDFLAERAADGEPFTVRRLPAHEFRLPGGDVPVIMIGPGVGVAPFRAFLRHRRATGASGRNWLFFGDQHREFDYLYEEEFTGLAADGGLHRLDLAFSRDQAEKRYVQDEMLANAAEIHAWVAAGASIFVCGDKTRMAPDVDRALTTILAGAEGAEAAGRAALAELKASGRYVKDVY